MNKMYLGSTNTKLENIIREAKKAHKKGYCKISCISNNSFHDPQIQFWVKSNKKTLKLSEFLDNVKKTYSDTFRKILESYKLSRKEDYNSTHIPTTYQ